MSGVTSAEIQVFLRKYLTEKLRSQGRDLPTDFSDDSDILLMGLVDSLDLLELLTALRECCGREIDFEEMDPEQMTIVGPLCRFISEQSTKS